MAKCPPTPELIGVFPIYNDIGVPMALVHCYKGQEEKCRRRAVQVGKTICAALGEKYVDNTQGTNPIFDTLSKHVNVIFPKRRI